MIKLVERHLKDLQLVASAPSNALADARKMKAALEKMDEVTVPTAYQLYTHTDVCCSLYIRMLTYADVC